MICKMRLFWILRKQIFTAYTPQMSCAYPNLSRQGISLIKPSQLLFWQTMSRNPRLWPYKASPRTSTCIHSKSTSGISTARFDGLKLHKSLGSCFLLPFQRLEAMTEPCPCVWAAEEDLYLRLIWHTAVQVGLGRWR